MCGDGALVKGVCGTMKGLCPSIFLTLLSPERSRRMGQLRSQTGEKLNDIPTRCSYPTPP